MFLRIKYKQFYYIWTCHSFVLHFNEKSMKNLVLVLHSFLFNISWLNMAPTSWFTFIVILSSFMIVNCQQNPFNNTIGLHMRLLFIGDAEFLDQNDVQSIMYHVNDILSKQINLYLQVTFILPGKMGLVLTELPSSSMSPTMLASF